MRTSTAVLAAALVGAVRVLQAERHSRRQLALKSAELHQLYCRDTATDPALRTDYEDGLGQSAEEAINAIHANRLIAHLSVKFRVGLLNKRALREHARSAMDLKSVRAYWARWGSHREREAKDSLDEAFNQIMSEAYDTHVRREPSAAPA